jgi:hypothetical protein
MTNDNIPPGDPAFHGWVGSFADIVSANAAAWGRLRNVPPRVFLCAVALLALMSVGSSVRAVELAGWDVYGQYYCGDSPLTPSNSAPNLTIVGLTRAIGMSVTASASINAWGGVALRGINTEADAIRTNQFITFSLTANAGNKVSCTTIPAYNIRRSSTSPTTGRWQYQVGTGAFTDIGPAITWGGNTSSTGNAQSAIDLSGISALQNVAAGTTITFRLVLWGASGSTGTWYINDLVIPGDDLQVQGTVTSTMTTPTITTLPTASAITYGQTLAAATLGGGVASVAGSFAFTSPAIKPAVGTASQSVTFTPTDTASYYPVVLNVSVTVNRAASGLALVASANPVGFGASLVFTATLPADAGGTVIFSATNGAFSTNAVNSGTAVSCAINSLPRSPTNVIQAIYSGDGNYLPGTNTLTQSVTNHPPAVDGNTYYRNGFNNWKIAVSDLLTNTSDVDGDAVTLVSLGVSTNGVTPDTGSTPGYVQYASTNAVDDQFTCTVTDGQGGTNIFTVTLAFSLTGAVTGTNCIARIVCGNPTRLTAYGVVNYCYITERSVDMVNWVDIQTNCATNGVINITDCFGDLDGNAPASAFYRLKWKNN